MKGIVIACDTLRGRKAAALVVDGRLEDFLIEDRTEVAYAPGAVLRAIVDRPAKGQGGAFVRLPAGNGFVRELASVRAGAPVLVQVTGYSGPGKAVPLSGKILLKGRYAIVTPDAPGINVSRQVRDADARDRLQTLGTRVLAGSPYGAILRSAAETAPQEAITDELRTLLANADTMANGRSGRDPRLLLDGPDPSLLARREWPEPDLTDDRPGSFERHGVTDAIGGLRSADTDLGNGWSIVIEATAAFVAVDVNTGQDLSPAAGLKANLAAARELPRQLRLRGLGGQVVVDMAPMPKKDRRTVEQALKSAFKADPVDTAVLGWTALGHVELQRRRERLPVNWGELA